MSLGNNKWIKFFLNKYVIVGLIFVVWMTYFDQNSYYLHKQINEDIDKLVEEKTYLENQINTEKEELKNLKNNPFLFEKIAREKYLMKKENEDIFVIEKKDSTQIEE